MMQHSPVMKMVGMITWAITSIVSINMLTMIYGYDLLGLLLGMMPAMELPIFWIIGISGFISLGLLVKVMFMSCPGCGACPCNCNKKD